MQGDTRYEYIIAVVFFFGALLYGGYYRILFLRTLPTILQREQNRINILSARNNI